MKRMEELKKFMKKQKQIRLAYLFGSYAKGKEGPLSDVDIAVFLDEIISKSKRFEQRLNLINEISSILKSDNVDVIIMNDAPLNLNYEIIKNGKLLVVKDEEKRTELESEVISKYLDRVYYERRGLNDFLKKILKRGKL